MRTYARWSSRVVRAPTSIISTKWQPRIFTATGLSKRGCSAANTITNTGTTFGGWALQFDFGARITATSAAAVVRHAGSEYVISDAGCDGVIAPGQSVTFRLRGTRRKQFSGPVDYTLDGVPVVVGQ
jgi:hypothetical protein